MPEQEHMKPVQLPAHPSILSSFLLFSLCCGRGLLALSEVALPGPTAVSSPSLPFWLGSSGVQTTNTQEQISSDLSCVPACKSNSTPGKGMQFHMPFLQLEKPSERKDTGGDFCSLEQGEPSSKPQLAGQGPPQPGSDTVQQLQGRATAVRQAQGEDEESLQVLGWPEQWDLEQGTAKLNTSTFRAQFNHELRPPGLSLDRAAGPRGRGCGRRAQVRLLGPWHRWETVP